MHRTDLAIGAVALLLLGAVVGAGASALSPNAQQPNAQPNATVAPPSQSAGDWSPAALADGNGSVAQFESAEAYATYVQRGRAMAARGGFGGPVREPTVDVPRTREATATPMPTQAPGDAVALESADTAGGDGGGGGAEPGAPDRISRTNVQERGLQEPDVLKTAGSHVFYAPRERPGRRAGDDWRDTQVVSAERPARPERVAEIEANGRMLVAGDTLVVVEDDALLGYDVSDPENPVETWSRSIEADVVTARLHDGSLYLVTRSSVSLDEPCPVEPLGGAAPVACTDVYRPDRQVPVDATYTAMRVAPDGGAVTATTSFVGTRDDTTVYMSENALYVTYTERANRGELRLEFLTEDQADRFPAWVTDRLDEIGSYDISGRSKRVEADRVLQQWYRTLDEDRRDEVRSNVRNDYRDFLTENQRRLVETGVVRVGVGDADLAVDTVGTVPGRPLDQFSLDEHEGTLRITTTIPAAGGAESRNDLYVLDDETLERRGAARNMGLNEEVYSVRYVGETAYVVTFRRIDPFHVVDLSDPSDPEEVGELELPGFSSYLHPVDDDHVLGIGEEDGRVKAVLFDVSDPENPTVDDDYVLDSRWSAVAESHHAFLMDRDHGVFFLPTGDGGKVIDYTGGDLSLEMDVDTDGRALRAMYVDDYMYVFGTDDLVVVDETDWTRERAVSLD